MSLLIRDLVHFERVEEVIKLRKEEQAREIVEKYVISDSLRRNLLYMLEVLCAPTHKSFNVVGNYGTGKSHFLAFVAAILEHPELRPLIQDEAVRAAAERLDRRYLVVKFELGSAAEVSLRYIFFDQVRQQLLQRYDVDVRAVDLQMDYDNKQTVHNILADLKAEDPEAGLVVVVDEISDFLKQKSKTQMAADLALLRELGEVSQDSDFLYIGAMQEHVFTNPKYVDQAESIARINQRFVTVTITKEDVAQVLTQRVVRKTPEQRQQLEGLFGDHQQYFPNLAAQMGRYVDLFPIHPYVIDVFERLPYFENRGIIGFAVNNVAPMLDEPAPRFVTYDRVFDLINATHEIRNQPAVAQVVGAVQTLEAKTDLLDADYRADARKLIKALAVLNLLGGEQHQGATSQELANTLLITPPRRLLVEPSMARDHIERVMKKIREVTVGQFIAYGADGRYALDLSIITDYDAEIEQKAQAAVDDNEVQQAFRDCVAADLGLNSQTPLLAGQSVYADTAPWPSRRAFRPGVLVIGKRDSGGTVVQGDYRFVVQGPLSGKSTGRQDEVVLALDFTPELTNLLTRARAAELLALSNVYRKEMTKIQRETLDKFRKQYVAALLERGYVLQGGHRTEVRQLPTTRPLNALADVVEHVKGAVLDPVFADRYPKYPTFRTLVTAANLEGEVTRALQALDRVAVQQLELNARGYLESFGAMQEGRFTAGASEACQVILAHLQADTSKMTSVEALLNLLVRTPWGLPKELVYLLLGALLFNGYVIFVQQGGKRLHAGEISPMLKQGLAFFEQIKYLELDKDIDVEGVVAVFETLGLQAGLVRDSDSRSEAVKALRACGLELRDALAQLRQGMKGVIAQAADFPDVPWLAVQECLGRLAHLDQQVALFADAAKVSDLGKLSTTAESRTKLQAGLEDLKTLTAFLDDWSAEGLGAGVHRMQEALKVLAGLRGFANGDEQTQIAALEQLGADSRAILSDQRQLLRAEFRRPLKGKVQQFKQQYDALYYGLHARVVGESAPWAQLEALRKQSCYVGLSRLKSLALVSSAEFTQLALDLQQLERQRCKQFDSQVLDQGFTTCPYCNFPEASTTVANLDGRIQAFQTQLEALWARWQEQILNELPGLLASRLPLLTPQHHEALTALQKAGKLPEVISDALLEALLELTSDLEPVELNLRDLGQALLARGGALTVEELRAQLEDYLHELLKHHDPELVRFRISFSESESIE